MRVLFCKISYMKYYKGACKDDVPYNGGKFVEENGYGYEELNFLPAKLDESAELKCMGFVETKTRPTANRANNLHIEKIDGCEAMKNEEYADDVLVIWCATRQQNDIKIVGWYNHATVFRQYRNRIATFLNGHKEERYYNITANAENCVLLPESERNWHGWSAPNAKTNGFGFGQALVWYATESEAEERVNKIIKNIKEYKGENWLNKLPSSD